MAQGNYTGPLFLVFIFLMGAASEGVPVNVDPPPPPAPISREQERAAREVAERLAAEQEWARAEFEAAEKDRAAFRHKVRAAMEAVSDTLNDATDPCYITAEEQLDRYEFYTFRQRVLAGEIDPTLWEHFQRWRQWRRVATNPAFTEKCKG